MCNPQIYRHIFFNHDTIKKIQYYTLLFTLGFLLLLYGHESREKLFSNMTAAVSGAGSLSQARGTNSTLGISGGEGRVLQILGMPDTEQASRILVQYLSYFSVIVITTYIIKKF